MEAVPVANETGGADETICLAFKKVWRVIPADCGVWPLVSPPLLLQAVMGAIEQKRAKVIIRNLFTVFIAPSLFNFVMPISDYAACSLRSETINRSGRPY
jgi:hypothetical protein